VNHVKRILEAASVDVLDAYAHFQDLIPSRSGAGGAAVAAAAAAAVGDHPRSRWLCTQGHSRHTTTVAVAAIALRRVVVVAAAGSRS